MNTSNGENDFLKELGEILAKENDKYVIPNKGKRAIVETAYVMAKEMFGDGADIEKHIGEVYKSSGEIRIYSKCINVTDCVKTSLLFKMADTLTVSTVDDEVCITLTFYGLARKREAR